MAKIIMNATDYHVSAFIKLDGDDTLIYNGDEVESGDAKSSNWNFQIEIEKSEKKRGNRAEQLLTNVCEYLAELLDEDDMTEEHSHEFFGMTKEEHKKYILGE